MGFVNEYVPDEDIEKYDLHGIWDKYYPLRKGRYYGGNRPEWTIDREAKVFLMRVGQGRLEHGNRSKFLLWCNEDHVVAELDLVEGSSGDMDDNPFMVVWELAHIDFSPRLEEGKAEIMRMLKEAVRAYGYSGARNQRPNTVVEFKF